MTSPSPMISILCPTYNHVDFIEETINSFLMQQVDVPFEIIIHDDASTDGTADIIRTYQDHYPEVIQSVCQIENQFQLGKWGYKILFKMARGKYIALCEGDDCWSDPRKLQKQFDFLESHPDCSISSHKVLYKFMDDEDKNYIFPDISTTKVFTKNDLYGKYISPTCSIMFRNVDTQKFLSATEDFPVGDIPLIYYYLKRGNLGYLNETMGVYRIHQQGIYSPCTKFEKDLIQFDTFIKIKTQLKIFKSKRINRKIYFYAYQILDELYKTKNYSQMRSIFYQLLISFTFPQINKLGKFAKYLLMTFLPDRYMSIIQHKDKTTPIT